MASGRRAVLRFLSANVMRGGCGVNRLILTVGGSWRREWKIETTPQFQCRKEDGVDQPTVSPFKFQPKLIGSTPSLGGGAMAARVLVVQQNQPASTLALLNSSFSSDFYGARLTRSVQVPSPNFRFCICGLSFDAMFAWFGLVLWLQFILPPVRINACESL